MEEDLSVQVKWSGNTYDFYLKDDNTVLDLKLLLKAKTNVPSERMKLLGLKKKVKTPSVDEDLLCDYDMKKSRITMMGQPDAIIAKINEEREKVEIIDDFDITEEHKCLREREEFVAKIKKRVREYTVKELCSSRDNKKLLVLDIDYTLFAATNMQWIDVKMREMGLVGCDQWAFVFYLDSRAMISVYTPHRGLVDVKPLAVIWGKYPGKYCKENTIMFDDISRNFLMNPENGLKIKAFKCALTEGRGDDELIALSEYLIAIKDESDLSSLDHAKWKKYLKKASNNS